MPSQILNISIQINQGCHGIRLTKPTKRSVRCLPGGNPDTMYKKRSHGGRDVPRSALHSKCDSSENSPSNSGS